MIVCMYTRMASSVFCYNAVQTMNMENDKIFIKAHILKSQCPSTAAVSNEECRIAGELQSPNIGNY